MKEDMLTSRVIWCVIKVHQTLGPGFLESIYRNALRVELRSQGLSAVAERVVWIYYEGHKVGRHVLDLLVENELVVEVKTVNVLGRAHYAQVRSYLKASGLKRGLLVNFDGHRADYRRVESPDPQNDDGDSVRSVSK